MAITIEELTAKVAELEQQIAAITAPPTEYYTSAYSGEEIDAAVKKVSEGLAGGVTSFNGRSGVVVPQAGDYTAAMVGSAPAQNDSDYSGCYYRMNGAAKEWINPPMQLGVEYRTAGRYNSKPVYAKAISFGQAPNATYKDVSHGIENFSQLVSYTGMMGGANLIETPALDSIQINASNIRITTNADVSASYVYLVLRYTKTTD
jgi:hypothetical protein|nr:MAG TPA: hypothetical protein [Caudoviricetes sp.]